MDLAKQVRKQAQLKGLMLQDVAKKLGITTPVFSAQINGNPTITTLIKIANAIGCNVSDFFDDDNEQITCPYCGRKLNVKVEKKSEN